MKDQLDTKAAEALKVSKAAKSAGRPGLGLDLAPAGKGLEGAVKEEACV